MDWSEAFEATERHNGACVLLNWMGQISIGRHLMFDQACQGLIQNRVNGHPSLPLLSTVVSLNRVGLCGGRTTRDWKMKDNRQ